MSKVLIEQQTFEKMLNVITQLPYAQVAQLLQEVGSNMEEVNGHDDLPITDAGDSPANADSGLSGVHQQDKE